MEGLEKVLSYRRSVIVPSREDPEKTMREDLEKVFSDTIAC